MILLDKNEITTNEVKVGDVFVCTDNPNIIDQIQFYQITEINSEQIEYRQIHHTSHENKKILQAAPLINTFAGHKKLSKITNQNLQLTESSSAQPLAYKILDIEGCRIKIYEKTSFDLRKLKKLI